MKRTGVDRVIVGSRTNDQGAPARRLSPYRFAFLLGVFDFCSISAVGFVGLALYDGGEAMVRAHGLVLMGGIIIYMAASGLLRVYSTDHVFEPKNALPKALLALVITFISLLLIGVVTKSNIEYSRLWFFSWAFGTIALVALHRAIAVSIIEDRLARGDCLNRALLVSFVPGGITAGQLALKSRNRMRAASARLLHDIEDLPSCRALVLDQDCDTIIVECHWDMVPAVSEHLGRLSDLALDVFILPVQERAGLNFLRIAQLGSVLLFQAAEPPLAGWNIVTKRILDMSVALVALLLLGPAMSVIAIAIKLESRGPILFRQVRAGFNGALIEVWKFRSMYAEETDPHATRQTTRHDARVTKIGRLIRRMSLDELPQLFNVLQGSMSIVGPRPHALSTTADGQALDAVVNTYAARHRTKPGITGWAQVNGLRGELDSTEKLKLRVEYDLDYIENWSLLLDLKIMGMTVIQVVHDPLAY